MSFSRSYASGVTSSLRTNFGSLAAMCIAMSCTSSLKSSVRATKSLSQLTSTSTPIFPPAWMYCATEPSLVTRAAFFCAVAAPFLRRMMIAFSRSPLDSVSAFLQSIMGAPVVSRSSLTCAAEIFTVVVLINSSSVAGRPSSAKAKTPSQRNFPQNFTRAGNAHAGRIPQRLKPHCVLFPIGTTKLVPFPVFPKPKACRLKPLCVRRKTDDVRLVFAERPTTLLQRLVFDFRRFSGGFGRRRLLARPRPENFLHADVVGSRLTLKLGGLIHRRQSFNRRLNRGRFSLLRFSNTSRQVSDLLVVQQVRAFHN